MVDGQSEYMESQVQNKSRFHFSDSQRVRFMIGDVVHTNEAARIVGVSVEKRAMTFNS
jgi:hypothetical protein